MAVVLPFNAAAARLLEEETLGFPVAVPRRPLLGELLVEAGALAPDVLVEALDQQNAQDQRLGIILLANNLISDEALGSALSQQSGLGRVDLGASPPDLALCAGLDPYRCLALECVPWRQIGGTRVIAIANPDNGDAAMAACGGGADRVALAIAPPDAIRRALTEAFAGRLRDDARERCPEAYSCRGWTATPRRLRGLAVILLALSAALFAPLLLLQAVLVWALVANTMTMGLRLVALFTRARQGRVELKHDGPCLADYKKLPRVSILVPLLREEAVTGKLLKALSAMDYPPALLDIKLVLEADDTITRTAIAQATLPRTIEVITVPADGLKTKPRAMNYALPFCRGDIVGIYDAEDRPDPGQIRAVVQHLQAAPPEVACVQGYLDFYNTSQNWLARCFTLEYAIWFRVVLLGVQRLGLPIPLGGTTVFFRRTALEQLGGWDAHNVTEDADLGMRLARFGFRCEMIASTTWEEANCRMLPWIKQRSRWLKGYAITWATHMQRPAELWRDLGPAGFIGFQVLFLGAMTSYLALPLFYILTAAGLAGYDAWATFPAPLTLAFTASMIAGQSIMIVTAIIAALDSARPGLARWVILLPFYWPLGAVAAWRALGEVFTRPTFWHKTEHGITAG